MTRSNSRHPQNRRVSLMLCAPKYLEFKVVGKSSTERRNKMGKLMSALLGIAAINSVAFAGGGGVFGGGQRTHFVLGTDVEEGEPHDVVTTQQTGSTSEGIGQFGGGIEVRITPHIGWVSDFSWNVVNGPNNNFGMVRTGVNFAF